MERKYADPKFGFSIEEIDNYYINVPDFTAYIPMETGTTETKMPLINELTTGIYRGTASGSTIGVPQDFYKKEAITKGVTSMSTTTQPNNFYDYELKVVDISHKEKKDHKRVLLSIPGTIEMSPHSNLKDTVLLKHAGDLAKIKGIEDADVVVSVEQKGAWGLKGKVTA